MEEILTPEVVAQNLQGFSGWEVEKDKIEKTFDFADFQGALNFVNKVGALAERASHHPEVEIHYNKVEIELSTHSVHGVTQKDIDLAKQIQEAYGSG